MACEKCIALKHYACAGKRGGSCSCSVCGSSLARIKKLRTPARRKPGPSQYKARFTPTRLTGTKLAVRDKYGIRTDFSPEQVELIFERKRAGGVNGTISALARELNTTRDRIRTVYNSKISPELGVVALDGCPHCGRPF